MEATKNGYERLMNGKHNLERLLAHNASGDMSQEEKKLVAFTEEQQTAFTDALADDLNTADALTAIYEIVRLANATLNEDSAKEAVQAVYERLTSLLDVLGIADHSNRDNLDEKIEALIAEREAARKAKDFAKADAIRDELAAQGIQLKDTRTGVTWSRE